MAMKQAFYMLVLLVLSQILSGTATQHCSQAEDSKYGMALQQHIFKIITGASLGGLCLQECYHDVRCQSFNYVISQYMCELNNRTKEARPEDYVPDTDRYYFRRDRDRVLLGSIHELPAESCKEIKASEGEQAVSGKYWFNSIIHGKTVLAHCDMEKEDVDECATGIPVCDVNADCQNTQESYRCSCKAGFFGDGKTCKAGELKAISFNCNGTADKAQGTINTPNYPSNYDHYSLCTWLISSSHRIQLVFTSFLLEVNYDFLYVYDGTSTSSNSSLYIGRYDGNMTGHVVQSTGEHLFLKFTSDLSITKQGFLINLKAIL